MSDRLTSAGCGVEVCLTSKAPAPHCPHGPTLLFERYIRGAPSGEKFYACSACRDRKECSFYLKYGEKMSKARQEAWANITAASQPTYTHKQFCKRLAEFRALPMSKRRFCESCSLLLLPAEWEEHHQHRVLQTVALDQLTRPTHLLHPRENKKTNAQYLFSEKTLQFFLSQVQQLGYDRVLCVGVPRLHETIQSQRAAGLSQLDSLLLDIDHRHAQFYSEKHFCHYNMFNHHFFDGGSASDACLQFLHRNHGTGIVMVTDPPFGGLVEVLCHCMKKLFSLWKEGLPDSCQETEIPTLWIFPYFMEQRIVDCLSSFRMLDYKVEYENHHLYQEGPKSKKRGSPVRIFTNLPADRVVLPQQEGYRFCDLCRRYVAPENRHCQKCNCCTSKDGRTYVHCDLCQKCVKPAWSHCESCRRCEPRDHVCSQTQHLGGCYICGHPEHKRRECPQRFSEERYSGAERKSGKRKRKREGNNEAAQPGKKRTLEQKQKFKKQNVKGKWKQGNRQQGKQTTF
ncbi:rRNA N(6)-adenosine-methyltransferase ZCCHC4-like isoform X1 [Branchiostoma floridae x Branchiostoma belcheri]